MGCGSRSPTRGSASKRVTVARPSEGEVKNAVAASIANATRRAILGAMTAEVGRPVGPASLQTAMLRRLICWVVAAQKKAGRAETS